MDYKFKDTHEKKIHCDVWWDEDSENIVYEVVVYYTMQCNVYSSTTTANITREYGIFEKRNQLESYAVVTILFFLLSFSIRLTPATRIDKNDTIALTFVRMCVVLSSIQGSSMNFIALRI